MAAYAEIHHFEVNNTSPLRDIDGDPMFGWYFQLMDDREAGGAPLTELTGPYTTQAECAEAAMTEWSDM